MKILIVNQPLNNRGDESAHKGLIRALLREIPEVDITVLFINANEDSIKQFSVISSRVHYINLIRYRGYDRFVKPILCNNMYFLWYIHPTIRKIISYIKIADWVVCAPGGICMGGFQDWHHIFLLKIAKWQKKKIAYYGRSFGPFPVKTESNRKFKDISLELLNYFSFLSIRDNKTQNLADRMGIKYVPTVDSAFLDSPHSIIPKAITSINNSKSYMVFVPNSLIWHYAYEKYQKSNIISFYSRLLDIISEVHPNYNIIMLPQTFNYNTYIGDDINFFYELKELKKNENIIVLPDTYSSDIQQAIISKAKYVVGARYHSVVFSINNNTPFIALSYEHKISGLLETLNMQNYMVDMTNTFENEDNFVNTIVKFKEKICLIDTNTLDGNNAKVIAKNCLNSFIQDLKQTQTNHSTPFER